MADNDAVMDVIFRFKTENQGAAEQAKKNADEIGKRSENSARMGERAFSRMGRGISTALLAATNDAGSMNKALADSVRMGNQLGQAFIFGGGIGIALTGIALAVGKLGETTPGVAALNQQLDQLANKDQAQRGLIELTGVTDKQAEAMLKAAASNPEFAKTLKLAADEAERARNPIKRLTDEVMNYFDQLSKNAPSGEEMFFGSKQQAAALGVIIPETKELSNAASESSIALANQAAAINENNRLMNIAKSALPQLVAENKNYSRALGDIAAAHNKAKKAFDADEIAAGARATESLVQAERSYARSLEEAARGRGREIEDDARARIALEKDVTRSILKLNQDLTNELKGINDDAVEKELDAKTYADFLRVRRDVERRYQDAIAKSNEARKEIEERKKERQEELNFQKARRDEDYEHQKFLLERSLNDARESTQKQLNDTLTAILQRRNEESAAYADSRAKASQAHVERIKELTDIRTEEQKTRDAANEVLNVLRGWAPAINLARIELGNFYSASELQAMSEISLHRASGFQRGGFLPVGQTGFVGEGGMEVIRSTPRGTQVTPMATGQGGKPIINVYIGGEKLDSHIDYRIEMNDRGL